jgi:hypothetical protein
MPTSTAIAVPFGKWPEISLLHQAFQRDAAKAPDSGMSNCHAAVLHVGIAIAQMVPVAEVSAVKSGVTSGVTVSLRMLRFARALADTVQRRHR